MTSPFTSVILCEDIRDETGNKKSLMGVFSGDILVTEFPAKIPVAMYFEAVFPKEEKETVVEMILLVEETIAAKATVKFPAGTERASFNFPKGTVIFAVPGSLRMNAVINGNQEYKLFDKRVYKTEPDSIAVAS
jgi:hypothetical protein